MSSERDLRRLERQIWELVAWRNVARTNLESWIATSASGEKRSIRAGDRWDDLTHPVRLSTTLSTSAPRDSLLEFFAEGDGLVYLDGVLVGAVSPFEREVPLGNAREIVVEVAPNDSFGEIVTPARLVTGRVIQPNHDMRALHRALLMAWETCTVMSNQDVSAPLFRTIETAIPMVTLPSDAPTVLRRMAMLREELKLEREPARSLNHHYHYAGPLAAIERLLTETMHFDTVDVSQLGDENGQPVGVSEALAYLHEQLAEIAGTFPPTGRLGASSHAHLDVAWLWPLSETRRKIRHTFASVLSLMDRYPTFHFTASSAQLFRYVQKDDPALFERVRERVHEGRIEPVGGMWLEPDCNLPHGESLVRHLLLGQRYFDREFGRRDKVAWLPDTFGLSGNLPQILAGAGIEYFFTQKLSWNDTNRFPHDLWLWEGIDGTRIVSHAFQNPIGGYNGVVSPEAFEATWRNYREKARHPESLFTFGMGDGGRGPTSDMLERFRLLEGFPALPRARHTTVEDFFNHIDPSDLPVWLGELYLEFHRGTYTTQARIKRLNRMAEHRLLEAETAATLANMIDDDYPADELDDYWTTLLRNQFHDILPGSSIRVVNEQAETELARVVQQSIELRDRAIAQLGGPVQSSDRPGKSIIVVNPQGFARPLSCVVSRPVETGDFRLLTGDGVEVPWQSTDSGAVLIHDPHVAVPGVGYLELGVEPTPQSVPAHGVDVTDRLLENDVISATIGEDGSIASLVDKRSGREVLAEPGNQLRLFHDLPAAWEAWNLTDTSRQTGEPLGDEVSLQVIEDGPLRGVIEATRTIGASSISQRYVIHAGSARLDIHTVIDWHERRRLLKAFFPFAVRSARATFETSYGAIERPTHRNTSWDVAKFEVPAQRWADLSEPGYGVSLLNDGRYGHSAIGNTLSLSLVRSPADPDPFADLGRHEFTYSIFPHEGVWHEASTVREAIDLNSPLIAHVRDVSPGSASAFSWLDVDGLTLGAVKRADDSADVVVRLYDPYGRRGTAIVRPHFPVVQAALTNLLEEAEEELEIEADGSIHIPYRPFQLVSLRLRRSRVNRL